MSTPAAESAYIILRSCKFIWNCNFSITT